MGAVTGRIVASLLTARNVDDGSQVGPLLDRFREPLASFTGDGANDGESVTASIGSRHPHAAIIVPLRSTAVPSANARTAPTQRDYHLRDIAEHGRMAWQAASGYTRGFYEPWTMALLEPVSHDRQETCDERG